MSRSLLHRHWTAAKNLLVEWAQGLGVLQVEKVASGDLKGRHKRFLKESEGSSRDSASELNRRYNPERKDSPAEADRTFPNSKLGN